MCSVDISSAFTNGDLDEYIYMRQPEGFHEGGPNKVCRLKKLLYGLKQAACQWNIKLHSALTDMGFKRVESDRSVYIYSNGLVRILVPIYIDDITFACKDGAAIDRAVQQLATHFKCRDLGATEFLLGVGITRDRKTRSVALHQCQFILHILERYNMASCTPVLTPMQPGLVLTKDMGASSPSLLNPVPPPCGCAVNLIVHNIDHHSSPHGLIFDQSVPLYSSTSNAPSCTRKGHRSRRIRCERGSF